MDGAFIESEEYVHALKQSKTIDEFGPAPYTLTEGEKEKTISNIQTLIDEILEHGKSGLNVQRYKGLGEMNPDQLWETTMDPARRSLLKVTIDDAVESDQIFDVLMGDVVEPRRLFIEKNALFVKNLDV